MFRFMMLGCRSTTQLFFEWVETGRVCVCVCVRVCVCVYVCVGGAVSKAALSLSLTEAHCSRSRDGNGAFGSRKRCTLTHTPHTHRRTLNTHIYTMNKRDISL